MTAVTAAGARRVALRIFACVGLLIIMSACAAADPLAELPQPDSPAGGAASTAESLRARIMGSSDAVSGAAAAVAAAAAAAATAAVDQAAYDREHAALLAFKATMPALDNTTWAELRWNASTNHCTDWLAVTCNNSSRVIQLVLQGVGLYGALDWQSLGVLSAARELNIDSNPRLAGTTLDPALPTNLPALELLWLGDNGIEGTIPETWGGWPKLFVLWMPGNQLSGPLPAAIGRNPQMQYLYLHNNRLERPLAGWGVWSSLANLRDLFLDINRLSGPLDMPFSSWPKLAELGLGDNQLTGDLTPAIAAMRGLPMKRLFLGPNNFSSVIPFEIGALSRLAELYLFRAGVRGPIPATLAEGCKSLVMFNAAFNNLTSIPANFYFENMTALSIYENQLRGPLPTATCRMSKLEQLWMFNNTLSGPLCPELAGATGLINVLLSFNDFSGPLPASWSALSNAVFMWLDHNRLSGGLPASWSAMSSVRNMRLDRNCLSGPMPCSWRALWQDKPSILGYNLRVCYNPKSADACGNSGATLYGCLPFDGSEDAKVTGNYTDVLCQAFDWLDMSRPEVEERVPWNTGTSMSGFCGGEAFSLSAPPADLGTCCRTLPTNSTCGLQYNPANCSGTTPAQLLGFYGQGPAIGFMSTAHPRTDSSACSDGARMGFFQTSCGTAAAARSAGARRGAAKMVTPRISAEAVHFNLTTYTAQSINRIRFYVGCLPPVAPPATAPNGGECSQWRPLPAKYTRTTSRNGTFAYTTWSHSLVGLDCGCSAAYTSIYIKSGTTCRL